MFKNFSQFITDLNCKWDGNKPLGNNISLFHTRSPLLWGASTALKYENTLLVMCSINKQGYFRDAEMEFLGKSPREEWQLTQEQSNMEPKLWIAGSGQLSEEQVAWFAGGTVMPGIWQALGYFGCWLRDVSHFLSSMKPSLWVNIGFALPKYFCIVCRTSSVLILLSSKE